MKKEDKIPNTGPNKDTDKSPDLKEKEEGGTSFPIVGMGASAGGLEAFEQFFYHVESDSGMAFVLVPHLDPGHASMLTEILQRAAKFPVVEAIDQMEVAPNHVYVIPPNKDMAIFHGTIQLSAPEAPRGQRMPIDFFFRSLAEDQGDSAICVILSGNGTDGTLGLRAIHGAGGISFVQDPASAKYDGMPRSAIESGLATYILPPEKMPAQLLICIRNFIQKRIEPTTPVPLEMSALKKILMLLRTKTGHDFSLYKQNTIHRRIERRMAAHSIDDPGTYVRYLQEHPEEPHRLFKELIINVTSFFRDAGAFEIFRKKIIHRILAEKPENYTIRVWVPGCSTGEEAYSIAIAFKEYMDESKLERKIQIYATDIDEDSITTARSGSYPANIAIDVSQERLKRFFLREEDGYRVKKEIRELVVFAIQNVVKDPPFTKLDLISCRNLLIYLEPELQNQLIPTFHYALKPGGILFLSPSENIGGHSDLFVPVDRKWKFFQSRFSITSTHTMLAGRGFTWSSLSSETAPDEMGKKAKSTDFAELTKKELLHYFAPPSVVIDEKGTIVYVHGDTGKYLRPAPGHASLNIVEMAREGLQMGLRTSIHKADTQEKEITVSNLIVKTNGGFHGINLIVKPLKESEVPQRLLLVSFQDIPDEAVKKPNQTKQYSAQKSMKRTEEIEEELAYTKETLQATIEEQQASNEELKSMNEELQSTNEELQSTNEELETSKEELQSVNEELVTVNSELQAKIEQLASMQSDMKNLLDNTNVATVFLDEALTIRRFTRAATKVCRFVASDTGRPLADIKTKLEQDDLVNDARAVLDSLIPLEKEVKTDTNEWYLLRVMPYRTIENMIDGVVLTFTDITRLKKEQQACDCAETVVDAIRSPLVLLDGSLKAIYASRSFYRTFQLTPGETIGLPLFELNQGQWDFPNLKDLVEKILSHGLTLDNVEIEHDFPAIGCRRVLLNGRRISGKSGEAQFILLEMKDAGNIKS